MEQSEIQKRVINLGKLIVDDLKLEPGVDTLSKWIAYYIAEQIVNTENKTGKDKEDAERTCFDTILKLWKNHSVLPDGCRPFEKFEPILKALIKLDPNNSSTYYINLPGKGIKLDAKNSVDNWIALALEIDKYAKSLIHFSLKEAASSVVDKKTIGYLENAACLAIDSSIVVRYMLNDKDTASDKNERIIKNIKDFKKTLNTIIKEINISLSQEKSST